MRAEATGASDVTDSYRTSSLLRGRVRALNTYVTPLGWTEKSIVQNPIGKGLEDSTIRFGF